MDAAASKQTSGAETKRDFKPLLIVGVIALVIYLIWRVFDNSRQRQAKASEEQKAQARQQAQAAAQQRLQAQATQQAAAAAAATELQSGRVVDATQSDFDRYVNSDRVTLALFWAPWCPHCKPMVPLFEQLGQMLGANFNVLRVDCVAQSKLKERFGIEGFPTVKRFRGGRPMGGDYRGAPDLGSLEAYAKGP